MNAELSAQAPKSPTKLRYSSTPYNRYISIDQDHDMSINSPPSPQRLQQFNSAEYLRLEPETDAPAPTAAQSPQNQTTVDIFKTQFRALINKNITLQKKQMGTNFCQLLTPIVCLFLLFVVKNVIDSKIGTKLDLQMDFPYVFNVPYKRLYNNMFTPIYINNCLQWYLFDFENATSSTKQFVYSSKKKTPLLKNLFSPVGNSQDFFYCSGSRKVNPFFNLPTNGSINNQIYNVIEYLNGQVYTSNRDIPGLYRLPDGAVTFYDASLKNLSYKIQINDINSPEYHRGNGITKFYYGNEEAHSTSAMVRTPDGQLALIDLLSRSYMQMINPNVVLTSGSQYMPMAGIETNFLLKLLSMTETILYPISLSLLLAVFMYTLVLEKEERLREMMKMNGMKMSNYWLVNYVWNFFLYLPSAIFFLLFGYFVVQMPFFVGTSMFILILTVVGWGFSQVSLAFFFQNFFYKSQMVTVVGYMLSIWTTIICVALNITIFPDPQTMPFALNLYPPFAFCRLIYNLCAKCADNGCISSLSLMTNEMWVNLLALYFGAGLFLVFGLYLEQVLPQEYGVHKHPLFFIKDLPCFKGKDKDKLPRISVAPRISRGVSLFTEDQEDEDVHEERQFVAGLEKGDYDKYPLIVKNLRKVYRASGGKPSKVAVKNFSLCISKGELFGLLGPNGAGKTSLISMLTGLYKPEKGNAWVAGYGIVNQIDEVRTNMGVCPQFDLLWPDLTVREHLLFYARMRGIPADKEKDMVDKAIEEVRLTQSANFKTRELSGGMKRRLSVAIAMVGDPKIIFFDEPTTGLDPENRRQLWDILAEARGNRAMVLTTHSMEEADVLCTRIGIVTKGQLRCIGNQTKLKSQYGSGYSLIINCQTDNLIGAEDFDALPEHLYQKITDYVQHILPKSELKSVFNGNFVFEVPLEGLSISKVFESLEANKAELGISDWGISQSTLEDVFMEVVEQADDFPTLNFRPS